MPPSTQFDSGAPCVKGKCEKTQKQPFMTGGKYTSPFPIVVKVENEVQANDVLRFADAIKIIKSVDDMQEQVRLALSLPGANDILAELAGRGTARRGLYLVVFGRECAIFTAYEDAVQATKGQWKPIWRKVSSFGRAIAYMISGGESEKEDNRDYQVILQSVASGTPQRPVAFHAPDAFPPHPIFQHEVFNTCLAEQSTNIPTLPPGFVYRHERNLRGVLSSHPYPLNHITPTPSCGPAVDALLQAFGYNVESKLTIARGLYNSAEMGEFVGSTAEHSMAALEAKYIWDKYNEEPPADEPKRYRAHTPGISKSLARRKAAEHRNEYLADAAGRPRQEKKKRTLPVKTPEDIAREAEAQKRSRTQKIVAIEGAREVIDEEVEKLNATFPGHSQDYFEREVLQTSILKKERKTSAYNAYMRAELKKLNDALPPGTKKYTPSSRQAAPINAAWNTMTDEEKTAAAAVPLADLVETKETVNTTKHNTAIAAFHDVLDTLKLVHEELRRLNIRTGAEIALVVVRSQHDHFPAPSTFTTSPRVDEFFNLAYKAGLDEFAWRLEAYCCYALERDFKRKAFLVVNWASS
ncbi:hypothetical protein C8Q80DRAFT_1119594 [Daedaleopsis nitida]|nr:hypothetical protein C8Q80DRAFT_1119594 [Daedaleopsis nitida]